MDRIKKIYNKISCLITNLLNNFKGTKKKILFLVVSLILVTIFFSFGRSEINISGSIKSIDIEVGSEYSLPEVNSIYYHPLFKNGIKAYVIKYNGILINTLGSYKVRYTTFFKSKEIIVNVVDTTCPTITLIEDDTYFIDVDEVYNEEGFKAIDNYDGDITKLVTTSEISNGIKTYTVTDSSGNTTTIERKIKYVDYEAPVITLETNFFSLLEGSTFSNPKFTAIDNIDGDITDKVVVTTNADTSKTGVYNVNLFVKDRYGNETSKDINLYVYHIQTDYEKDHPSGKVIYLTFDDGPSGNTSRLLDYLDKYNVKATFFVTGNGNSDLIGEEYRRGHSIGIHTYSHDYASIYQSEEAFYNDLYTMDDIIYNKTGIHTMIMRFPGGSSNTISKNYSIGIMSRLSDSVQSRGYHYFDWNVSSGDGGANPSSYEAFNSVITSCSSKNTCIVLQHDTKSGSIDAVPMIIEWGIANGYTFLPITYETASYHHGIKN